MYKLIVFAVAVCCAVLSSVLEKDKLTMGSVVLQASGNVLSILGRPKLTQTSSATTLSSTSASNQPSTTCGTNNITATTWFNDKQLIKVDLRCSGGTDGIGNYLFTLPVGVQFNPTHDPYSSSVGTKYAVAAAALSTTHGWRVASLCIDGDTTSNTYCHTSAYDSPQWLQLDLGSSKAVGLVKIFNRVGSLVNFRLAAHTIWIGDTAGNPIGAGNTQCWSGTAPSTDGPFDEVCNGNGRYVYIYKTEMIVGAEKHHINLREVEVYAPPTVHNAVAIPVRGMVWYNDKAFPAAVFPFDANQFKVLAYNGGGSNDVLSFLDPSFTPVSNGLRLGFEFEIPY
jgi:hypothetical protein